VQSLWDSCSTVNRARRAKMPRIPHPSSVGFQAFSAKLRSNETIERLSIESGLSKDEVQAVLSTAIAESAQTLRVLAGLEFDLSDRLLEVGAGLGATSAFLSQSGFCLTALEPGGVGFEMNVVLSEVLARVTNSHHAFLRIGAEELDPELHGLFSLVFSNNVLEHIDNPEAALQHMQQVQSVGGVNVHSCPNYSIPFEPHFGIPLLPLRPSLTSRVLPRSIAGSGLWKSLNFIRAQDVTAWTKGSGRTVTFRTGALATSLTRLTQDSEFRKRHRILGAISNAMKATGALRIVRALPPRWSTPMDFIIHDSSVGAGRVDAWSHTEPPADGRSSQPEVSG
jgi:2-polyprenyl-3-methyl-5-hydroxy-6-metoxy-1,4-benzoquinol methylase